jgi:DNA (cytosine-5)-methyltransferase 1
MKYLELFAGAGGLSRGLDAAGMTCAAHAEIEPHARAVLRRHWPHTPLYGDVTAVDWTAHRGVDLVSGGSPCQDLSVAGKRAGLEGARSGLFYELIRAWQETDAPYCLWENVDGARSSNRGADFAAVLSAFVGAAVAVPADGWRSSGVAAGSSGVAAWRVLDLQHFGPPQRRRRVFVLAARTGGVDPAEVLALSEGVCGHPAPRERSRQGVARGAAGGVGASGGAAINISNSEARVASVMGSLQARTGSGGIGGAAQMNAVLAFEPRYYTRDNKTGGAPSDVVKVDASIGKNGDAVPHVLAFHPTQDPISGSVSPALGRPTEGMGVVCTTGPVTHSLTHEGADASEDGTGRGTPIVVGTLMTTHYGKHAGCNQHVNELVDLVPVTGRPRRLTPLECERLMSWPDHWTAEGVREDGTTYALSDTARYRLCGNGVGSVVAEWIGKRLMWAEGTTAQERAA